MEAQRVTVARDGKDVSGQVMVRLLGPGDRPILELLALHNAAFDVDGRGAPQRVLKPAAAEAYLADPAILHWVAEQDGEVVGDLVCHVQRLSAQDQFELMLYDIGVRATHRRRGIGRRLVAAMNAWMADHRVTTVWVLADNPGAERFYGACGFQRDEPQPVAMSRTTVPAVTP